MVHRSTLLLVFLLLPRLSVAQQEHSWLQQQPSRVDSKVAVFLTHFTKRLDKIELTRPALRRLVETAKRHDIPVVSLQEGHRPASEYFCNDYEPSARVESDIGLFELDTQEVEHAIVAGGYYELCLNNTVKQLIANWQQRGGEGNLKITYVLDAIYAVFSDREVTDSFDREFDFWLETQPATTVLLSSALDRIEDRQQVVTFLSRRWNNVPRDFGFHFGVRNVFQFGRDAQPNRPTLMIAYMAVEDLAKRLEWEAARPKLD